MRGFDWNGETFTLPPEFQKADHVYEFTSTSKQYTIWTITLNPNEGGDTRMLPVDPDKFPPLDE